MLFQRSTASNPVGRKRSSTAHFRAIPPKGTSRRARSPTGNTPARRKRTGQAAEINRCVSHAILSAFRSVDAPLRPIRSATSRDSRTGLWPEQPFLRDTQRNQPVDSRHATIVSLWTARAMHGFMNEQDEQLKSLTDGHCPDYQSQADTLRLPATRTRRAQRGRAIAARKGFEQGRFREGLLRTCRRQFLPYHLSLTALLHTEKESLPSPTQRLALYFT